MTFASVMVLAAVLAAAPVAWAGLGEGGDREAAREDVRSATAAFNLGHYAEAAALYERAYKLVPDPILLYDLGQSCRLAGQLEEALIAYRSYLRTAPDEAPNRQRVREMIGMLERAVGQKKELQPAPAPPEPPRPDLISLPRTEDHLLRRWAPWAGVGATVALGVAAVAEGLWADSTFSSLQSTCGKTKSCTASQLSGGRSQAAVTNVLWGLAAASAAAAGVAFYVDYSAGKGAGITLVRRY